MVFLVLWGLITHGTSAGTGDEPHYEIITHSIAFDHDFDLTGDYANMSNRALGGVFEATTHVQPGKDGRLRSVHDVGMPLLFAPYYAAAYAITTRIVAHVPPRWLARARLNFMLVVRHLLSFAMIGITALIAVRLLEIFTALSVSRRRAFAFTLLLVLSPPILSHSFLFFTEIVSAFIGLGVFIWLRGAKPSRAAALTAGAALGYLMLVHVRNAGLIAGLLILALLRARRPSTDRAWLAPFMCGAAALFAVRTAVTYHFWGTWLTTPHERFGEVRGLGPLAAESGARIIGWLFDQEHGLLPYAPIYLLVPAGWLALRKSDRPLWSEITIVAGAYLGVMTMPVLNAHGWRGGWTPAARYLMPVAPFLAILAFAAVARFRRLPVIVFVIVAVQVSLDAILWQRPGLLWNDGIGRSALLTFLDRGTGRLSSWAPSIFPPLDARTVAIIAAASAVWLLLTAALAMPTITAERAEHAES